MFLINRRFLSSNVQRVKHSKSAIRRLSPQGAETGSGTATVQAMINASNTHEKTRISQIPEVDTMLKCRAYCTARQYNLREASRLLQREFSITTSTEHSDDYLHLRHPQQSGIELFLLKDGCMVSWNSTRTLDSDILNRIRSVEIGSFDTDLRDAEEMLFTHALQPTEAGMRGENIYLPPMNSAELTYARLAFSHGLARSTQLGVLEKHLELYLESIEDIPLHMMRGQQPPLTAKQVMQKHGQLLYIRGLLNLHSDLVDSSPEFYWSRTDLAKYFESISRALDIPPRIRVLNQRLDHASSLVGLMQDHLNTRHGTRMEWIIIALIAVEVVFETVHYMDAMKYVDLFELIGNKGEPWLPRR